MSDMEEETLDLASEQDTTHTLEKKVKKAENSFKFKGHQVQYELNVDLQDLVQRALDYLGRNKSDKAVTILNEALNTLKKKKQAHKIADKSEGGWKTVQEYLSDDLASDSEDEKKIRAADTRAVKKLKSVKSADKKQNHAALSRGADLVTETRSKGPGKEICVSGVDYLDIGHPTAKKTPRLVWLPEELRKGFQRSYGHFTDASDTGAAGFIQNSTKFLHKMWLETERGRSSTWREVKAIQLCVSAFSKLLQNSIVTFHTDNKNAVSIINKGSKKIFSTGFWKNDTQVKHTELKILFRKMKNSVIDSKARNTTVKYAYSFKRFVVWSEKYTEIKSVLPANEIYVSLYLQYLMQSAKHYSTIEAACYAIKWAHSLAGFEDPCASDIVKCIVEASKRKQ
ncbi:unnamed protein product [Mytilus coruscus]|uniref:Reverse transcriptase RNase H-like domain-containing protein n=1 Tax=Mytilus coruscus TaxID=42192 RepID=A0A6J8EJ89_MYTCO|nr:unnamed protein product [Mytilus coruscus]